MGLLAKLINYIPGPKTGLSRHLTILLINFGIVPLVVLFLALQYYEHDRYRKVAQNYHHGLAWQSAVRLESILAYLAQEVKLAAWSLSDLTDQKAARVLLEELLQRNPLLLGCQYYPTAEGKAIQTGNFQALTPPFKNEDRKLTWEYIFKDGSSIVLVRESHSSHLNYAYFSFTVPGKQAKLTAVYNGAALWNQVTSEIPHPPQGVYLINTAGELLSSSLPPHLLQGKNQRHPVLAAFRRGQTGVWERYPGLDGAQAIGASAKLPSYPWAVVVEDKMDAAYGPLHLLPIIFICIYILTIAAAIILGMFFSRRQIMVPLRRLQEQVASLIPNRTLVLDSEGIVNEIEALNQAFADIKKELQETTVSRDLLAQEVKERQKVEEALRQSETTLKNILVTVPMGLGYIKDWLLVWGNDYLSSLTGYPLADLLQQDLSRLFSSLTAYGEFTEKIDQQLKQGPTAEFEVAWQTRDGQVLDILFKCARLEAAEAEVAFIFAAMDITTRKRLEQESLKISKLESLGILAGGLAHDFNNILTVILGNLELLRLEVQDNPQILRRLLSIEEAGIRARNLSRQLLTFAKGGMPLKRQIKLQDFLPDAVTLSLSGSRSAAQISLPPDLWPVEVDVDQLHQAINNILLNAEQAMPQGGTIDIKARNLFVNAIDPLPLPPGRYVQISIVDHGCGIAPEHLSKIFDPYFSTKPYGNGLGLTTTYSIIKNHKGHIAVESTVGQGTRVHLYLPAAEEKAVIMPGKVAELPQRGEGRVLVMDDEKEVRLVVKQMLGKLGYEAVCVKDGQEAITAYREAQEEGRPFAVVILDLTIPGGMGGEATLTALRQIDPEVKAVVSSGYSDYPVMSNYADFGFCGVIAKPYKISDLSRVLQQILAPKEKSWTPKYQKTINN